MKHLLFFLILGYAGVLHGDPILLESESFPALGQADPLLLENVEFGVGVRPGEAMALAYIGKNFGDVSAVASEAFLNLQSFDHAAQTFGEFHVYPVPSTVTARGPGEFTGQQISNALLGARANDLYSEIDTAESEAGSSFEARSVVLDLFRHRGDWYMRWDGNLEGNVIGKGGYAFNRKDMVEDILNEIESVATNHKPKYFIIGDGMERFLGEEGLAPGEYSNFLAFYKDAVARIKKGNSETKVGCGINYDNFLSSVVPSFHNSQTSHNEIISDAFESVVLPCAEMGDIVALRSYRSPDDQTITLPTGDINVTDAYQFLRRLSPLYGVEKPIVWYSIGSPLAGPVNYVQQRNYLSDFLEWTAGTQSSTVVWRYALNLDGSDTGDQAPAGRCEAFTESSRDFERPVADCYDGLLTSVFSKKDAFKHIDTLIP